MGNPEKPETNLLALSSNAARVLKALDYPLSKLIRSNEGSHVALDFDDKALDEAIRALSDLKDGLMVNRENVNKCVGAVLDSPHGALLAEKRKDYANFEDNILGVIPMGDDGRKLYEVSCRIPSLKENPDDQTTVLEVKIGHYQNWGDDFDYGARTTLLKVILPEGQEEIRVEITGDEIRDTDNDFGTNFDQILRDSIQYPKTPPMKKSVEFRRSKIVFNSTGGENPKFSLDFSEGRNEMLKSGKTYTLELEESTSYREANGKYMVAQDLAKAGMACYDIFFKLKKQGEYDY